MSNPNNALGTNAAFGGRTSVNAFNDVLSAFSGRGILSGWGCAPSSGLTVTIGGNGTDRDVAIAEDAGGNKTTVNNITQSTILVTMSAAPASNSRIDSIVAYIESSPSSDEITDNYDAVNLLVVNGTAASTPSAPDDNAIRTAITADGASGPTAYYVVLANITIASGTTDIDAGMISSGGKASVGSNGVNTSSIASGAVTADKIDWTTLDFYNFSETEKVVGTWIDGAPIYRKVYTGTYSRSADAVTNTTLESSKNVMLVDVGGALEYATGGWVPISYSEDNTEYAYIYVQNNTKNLILRHKGVAATNLRYRAWVEYVKLS